MLPDLLEIQSVPALMPDHPSGTAIFWAYQASQPGESGARLL